MVQLICLFYMENRLWPAWLPDQDMGPDFPGSGTRFPRIRGPISKDTEPDYPGSFPSGSHQGRLTREVQMEQAGPRSRQWNSLQRHLASRRAPRAPQGNGLLRLHYWVCCPGCSPVGLLSWGFSLLDCSPLYCALLGLLSWDCSPGIAP